MLHGGGELGAVGAGRYRPLDEHHAWRIHRDGEGLRVLDTEGTRYRLGVTANGRIGSDDARTAGARLAAEEIVDPLGNRVAYRYRPTGISSSWRRSAANRIELQFRYEPRPDPVIDGRAGFLIATSLRCTRIELYVPARRRRWCGAGH